jgi:hypothetical protein
VMMVRRVDVMLALPLTTGGEAADVGMLGLAGAWEGAMGAGATGAAGAPVLPLAPSVPVPQRGMNDVVPLPLVTYLPGSAKV